MTSRSKRGPIPAALFICLLGLSSAGSSQQAAAKPETKIFPHYSTAGFFAIEGSPRQVFNFNLGWR